MSFKVTLGVVLLLLASLLFLLPPIAGAAVRLVFRLVGGILQSRTKARRDAIIARVRSDEDAFQSQQNRSRKSADDEDWEKVEGYAAGTAPNGGKADEDWEGVIGFFHPFW